MKTEPATLEAREALWAKLYDARKRHPLLVTYAATYLRRQAGRVYWPAGNCRSAIRLYNELWSALKRSGVYQEWIAGQRLTNEQVRRIGLALREVQS